MVCQRNSKEGSVAGTEYWATGVPDSVGGGRIMRVLSGRGERLDLIFKVMASCLKALDLSLTPSAAICGMFFRNAEIQPKESLPAA